MFKRIKKWLAKKFIPDADEISELIADKIADFINSQDESTQNKIMKYSEISIKVEEILHDISVKLKDAKIDGAEAADIAQKMLPLVQIAYDKALENI